MSTAPAPYPADTRAKGWRFELDYEQIEQSGTWSAAMAAALEGLPLARPFLLAMWYAAWKQVPCGSLPSDDRELAGTIGIPPSIFAEYRDVLLRGWWKADDGRLYHNTIAKRVVEMMGKRRCDSDRQAARRAREASDSTASHDEITHESRVTPPGVVAESSTDHRPPTTDHRPPSVELRSPETPLPSAGFADATAAPAPKRRRTAKPKPEAPTAELWEAYRSAYAGRYRVDPVRNAKVNAQLGMVIARLGAEEAPQVAAFFVGHNNGLYVSAGHVVDLLLRDAEKLRTEWVTGRQVTRGAAAQVDRTQTTLNAFQPLIAEAREREGHDGQREAA